MSLSEITREINRTASKRLNISQQTAPGCELRPMADDPRAGLG